MCILICMNTKQMPFVSEHIVLILRVHALKFLLIKNTIRKESLSWLKDDSISFLRQRDNTLECLILQARCQHCVKRERSDAQAGFRKGRGTRDQTANIRWIIEKAREFQKNIYFCFIDYTKAFDCVDHNKQWKILQEMGIPDHLTCFLRNLYAGQEATVCPRHGTMDWLQGFLCFFFFKPSLLSDTSLRCVI